MDVLKDNALFFKGVPPPHGAINCFEDELGLLWHYSICGSKRQCCQHEECIYYGTRSSLNPDTQSDVSNDLMKMRTMIHLSYNHISG